MTKKQFVKLLKTEARLNRVQAKRSAKGGDYDEAYGFSIQANTLDWVADEAEEKL